MANEFRHKDAISGRVRENEYEHIRQHILNGQATGDIVYASSATQLSGLPIGTAGQFIIVSGGTLAWSSTFPVTIGLDDDILLTFGDDNDIAMLNRSTILGANTALANVLIGTPVTPAIAANSLIIANKTSNGDIMMAGNDGGNSKAFLYFDASTPNLYLYNVGGTWTAGATTWTIPAVTLGNTLDADGNALNNVNYIVDNSANPPTAGFLRMGHGVYIIDGRNNANSLNRDLFSWGLEANDTVEICGDGDDLKISGVTHISLAAAVNSHLLIDGTARLNANEQAIYINFPSETVATNGIWITLGSNVIAGDLSGIRSRVTGNAASAGANVRGAYLEAKVGANLYAAMLEGALLHADYSAGGATISGDVRGLTVQISQGSGLNAANLYGILLNIQTRSDETITANDVGLLIRNEAVGGNGRAMDSAIMIAGLNMGGGTNPFVLGIDFSGATFTTADIKFHHGATLLDDGTDLTLAGANLVGAVNPTSMTLGGTVILNSQEFAGTIVGTNSLSGAQDALILKDTYIGAVANRMRLGVEFDDDTGVPREGGFIQWRVDAVNGLDDIDVSMRFAAHKAGSNVVVLKLDADKLATFYGDITLDSGDVMFSASVDSAAVADQVSLGGYEIAPGQRSLAISQENPVVTEAIGASDRTLPVRINGATYKILLHS